MKSYALIKVIVDEIDKGDIMTSLTLRSGKRVISVLLPTHELFKCSLEVGREAYCFINGKDILVFRDMKYLFKRLKSDSLVKEISIMKR
ncbi:MAG: hypothetical protein N3C60_00135 [Calditerrivibrio sp.]|nr:hypothetical protein [Calditerrivibrio sp.]